MRQYDAMRDIRMKALFSYHEKDIYEINMLDYPIYPENDIKTAERMNLKLLAEDYKEKYEMKLQDHKNLKSWLNTVEHLIPQWNLLLALNSNPESNMCWWDRATINFIVKDDDLKNSQEIKAYAFLESA
jgi:hypothetical protein